MQKRIVLPGEKVAESKQHIPNTYWQGTATYAAAIGTMDEEGRYIALESRYKPMPGDLVVGVVIDVRSAGYEVYINLPINAFIPSRTLRINLDIGNIISCKVVNVNEVGDVDLTDIITLSKGQIMTFPTAKVPRLIGKKSSMLSVIKQYTGGEIIVGNNGFVWVSEQNDIPLVIKAINLVIKKAHLSGLTDEMDNFLKNEKLNKG